MKRDVGDMLTTLIRNQAGREAPETAAGAPGELTALGLTPMRLGERHVAVDLSRSRIFRNLNTFVSLLADEVIEQCAFGIADVMVRRKVDPRLTPELAAAGLDWVTIYVRLDAAEGLPFNHRSFSKRLQEMESRLKLAGSYTLSRQFTPLDGADVIDRALTEEPDFLSGMRLAAGHLFFSRKLTRPGGPTGSCCWWRTAAISRRSSTDFAWRAKPSETFLTISDCGIPREIVDEVVAQLFTLSRALVRRQQSQEKLPCALLAVDSEIDAEANALAPGGKSRNRKPPAASSSAAVNGFFVPAEVK